MPLQNLQFRPGVNREGTDLANTGGWYSCDKVRFRSGSPEKIGGWVSQGTNTFLGTCKHILEWVTLNGYYLLGIGTNLKYYIFQGGVFYDVTPIRSTETLGTNPFLPIYGALDGAISATDTTITVASGTSFTRTYPYIIKIGSEEIYVPLASGDTLSSCIRGYNGTAAAAHSDADVVSSSWLVVNAAAHGAIVNDFVTLSDAVAFGPYATADLNAEVQILAVTTNYFAYDTGIQSTSATAGGGSEPPIAEFQLNTGKDITSFGNGWGAGPYGIGRPWNEGYISGIEEELRLWSADNYGEDLIFNPRDGAIYYWQASDINPNGTISGRAVNMRDMPGADAQVPKIATSVFVTEERHVVAIGTDDPYAVDPDIQDPMLVRWSEQEDYRIWEPLPTNTAGFQRLAYGSRLITAEKTRQETLVWSDNALYSMRYLGPPYTFGFNTISNEVTIASPNAVATANNVTYWMGRDTFYAYSGRVDTLPCTLRQYIFEDINLEQDAQIACGTNEKYTEIWWFYCSSTSDTIDRYVVYNYLEKLWYYGSMTRTFWMDSHIQGYPWAAVMGQLYQHEVGADDGTTNPPQPISAFIESSDFSIGEGMQYSFVKRIIPDVDFIGSTTNLPSVNITIQTRNFPGQGTQRDADSKVVSSSKASIQVYNYTHQSWIRIRGRQVAFQISSNTLGTKWQLGMPRLDVNPDGRR